MDKAKLKGYIHKREKILKEHREGPVFIKLLEYSESLVNDYLKASEFPIYKNKELSRQTTFRKSYIIKDEYGFEKILTKRKKYHYKALVYKLICKVGPFKTKVYFGWTKLNLDDRLKIHIIDAISPHGQGFSYPNVVELHKAIRNVLGSNSINFDKIYKKLQRNRGKSEYWIIMKDLINLLKDNFNTEVVELHREVKTAKEREKWYTLNYINDDKSFGTIKPNGLNEVAGGSGGGEYIDLPIVDIAAMISLGINEKSITKIINTQYKRVARTTIASRIRDIWGSFAEARTEFLRPVVEALIKDNLNFLFVKDICYALNMHHRSLTNYLRDWYKGRGFSILKSMIKKSILDWFNLEEYVEEIRPELKRIPLEQWERWLIEGFSGSKIGKFLGGLSKSAVENIYRQIPELGSIRETRKALRREKAIELFKEGWDPKEIMIDIFKMKPFSTNDVIRFYEYLFQYYNFIESFYES